MKRTLLLVCLAAPAAAQEPAPRGGAELPPFSIDGAREATGDGWVFIELSTPRDAYFVGELIRLRLRVGVEQEFLRTSMLPLSSRRIDVPIQVQASWLDALPGTIALGADADAVLDGRERLSLALADAAADAARAADRALDGRTFTVLEIERSFLPTRAGELAFPEALAHFAYATRFEDDFVNGRMPVDRRDAFVRSVPLKLAVLALPEVGRPPEFTGAVGRFTLQAQVEPRELTAGESLRLVLEIEGQGNLEQFDAPRLDRLEGFRVLGQIEHKGRTRRTVTYDLAPLNARVKAVPGIAFAYFDTTPPAAYRTAHTTPIPITVRPPPARVESAPPPRVAYARPSRWPIALETLAVVSVLALALYLRRRARAK